MKKEFIFIFLLLFLCIFSANQLKGQNTIVLTIEEEFSPIIGQNPIIDTESKQIHLRSDKAAQINAVYVDENAMNAFHPLAMQIINQAIGKWEKKLSIPENLVIDISFDLADLGSDLAYYVDVPYAEEQNINYPIPLAQIKFGFANNAKQINKITLNKNSSLWYFDGDSDNPTIQSNQYDFETAVLRALAHAFGFGSAINGSRPNTSFYNIFDNFLINSNNQMMVSNPLGSDLTNFITGDNVFWKTSNGFKIFAKSPYNRYTSLKYFDSENELMSANFKAQTGNRNIDAKVTQVMEDIGWSVIPENLLTIKSSNMDNATGIGNVNNSYSFYAESPYTVSGYLWTYKIRKKDNSFETISTSSSSTFSINPLTLNDNYYRDEYGDICGKITLQVLVNGTTVSTEFNIWLEASPANIEYDVKIIKESDWYYNLEVTVYSAGATNLTLTLNDYSIGESLTTVFNNHQYVKYTYGYLYYDSPVSIDFSSQNSYGKKSDSYYINGISYYNASLSPNVFTDIKSIDNDQIDRREVYTIMGSLKLVLDGNQNINTASLKSGVYIVKTFYRNGTSSSEKLIKNKY